MPLSPRTEMLAGQAPPVDAEAAFEEQFAQLAQSHLMSRHPDLADYVQQFKVMQTDLENDLGVGDFILDIEGQIIHLPVVATQSRIQPIDMMYVEDMEAFLPFDEQWIDLVAGMNNESQLGEAVKAPKLLQTDVDIRNVVVPPMTGRYSYASVRQSLPEFLQHASNGIKKACIEMLQRSPKIARHAFELHGKEALATALQPKETLKLSSLAVEFCNEDTPTADLHRIFEKQARIAYFQIMQKGYAVRDHRPDAKLAVFQENLVRLTSLERPGIYELYLKNGETRKALIVPGPARLDENIRYYNRASARPRQAQSWTDIPDDEKREDPIDNQEVLIYTDKGELLYADGKNRKLPRLTVGIVDDETHEGEGILAVANVSQKQAPKTGTGFFLGVDENRICASSPVNVKTISSGSGDSQVLGCTSPHNGKDITIRRGGSGARKQIHVIDHGNSAEARVPNHFLFISSKKELDPGMIAWSPKMINEVMSSNLKQAGAQETKVAKEQIGYFIIDGQQYPSKIAAIKHLIVDQDLSVGSAENIIKLAEHEGRTRALITSPQLALKLAQEGVPVDQPVEEEVPPEEMPPEEIPPEGMPPEGIPPEGMPPEMMMDPAMMGPSPVEQAAQEVMTILNAQSEEIARQLQQQEMLGQARIEAINAVLQRSMEIEQGAPPMMYEDIRANAAMEPPMSPEMGGMPGEMGPEMGGVPEEPIPPVGDEVVEDAADIAAQGDGAEPFDTSAIAALISEDSLDELALDQLPQFRETLDGISRVMFEMRVKAPQLQETIGDQKFDDILNKLRKVQTALGSVLLSLYKNNLILQGSDID